MEEEIKLGQEPAFPFESENVVIGQISFTYKDEKGNDSIGYSNEYGKIVHKGMSKRLLLAGMAMQGLLANPELIYRTNEVLIKDAFELADELLVKEHETDNK